MPESPFPSRSTAEWRENFAAALTADERVNLPADAIQHLVEIVPFPKALLRRRGGTYELRDDALEQVGEPGHTFWTLRAEIHGAAETISPHNDRIAVEWATALEQPTAERPALPRRTSVLDPETGELTAALRIPVSSRVDVENLMRRTSTLLGDSDQSRRYSLRESLSQSGQREPGLSVLTAFDIQTGDGIVRRWAALATAGNNRVHARLSLFGIEPAQVILGVPYRNLGEQQDGIETSPAAWLTKLSANLNRRYAADQEDAARAKRVATVPTRIVVGADPADQLSAMLRAANILDHVQAKQEYQPRPLYDALGRRLIEAYTIAGHLSTKQAEILAGDRTPIPGDEQELGLEQPLDGSPESLARVRDWRDRTALALVFPTDAARQQVIRRVLSEPARTQIGSLHVTQRARVLSAIQSRGYGAPWNPRAAEMFQRVHGTQGIAVSDTPLEDLLEEARESGVVGFELKARMLPLLINADLIQADRGSAATEGKLRRSPTQVITAISGAGARGVALLTELRDALVEQRSPRQIDQDGNPIDGEEADRTWLDADREFRARPTRRQDEPAPEPEPEPETDHSRFAHAYDSLLDGLSAARDGLQIARETLDALTELKASTPELGLADDERNGLDAQLEELADIIDELYPVIRELRTRRAVA